MPLNILVVEGTPGRTLFDAAADGLRAIAPGVALELVRVPAVPLGALPGGELLSRSWDLVLLTLTAELAPGGPAQPERERLLAGLIEAQQARGAAVALATIFRHVPRGERQAELRAQIRVLNQMVRRLSHQLGCFVLDLDRELAHEGALAMEADCFSGGERAAEVACSELLVLAMEMLGDKLQEAA